MIEPPLQLVCFEYRDRLRGGRTRPLLVAAMDENDREYQVVLKVRHPDVKKGHFEGTSLACELICSTLARGAGLSVPDYACVEIPQELPAAVGDRPVREVLARNVGVNFGCVYHEGMALWNPDDRPRSPDLLEGLEEVLAFDATTINGDRKREKPNLLWRGENLLMIDHSLALPVHIWADEEVDQSPLFPEAEVRAHCVFAALQGKELEFRSFFDHWPIRMEDADLARLRSWIPESWERRAGDLDKILRFLQHRPRRFMDIAADLRRVVA